MPALSDVVGLIIFSNGISNCQIVFEWQLQNSLQEAQALSLEPGLSCSRTKDGI